jgi:hypothetical protein
MPAKGFHQPERVRLLGCPLDEHSQPRRQLARMRVEHVNRQFGWRKVGENFDKGAGR